MTPKNTQYDVIIIGGGFYGSMLAIFLKKYFKKILLIEKEEDLLTKASYNNQARVHNGYHYPRSFITAHRSHINASRFISEFSKAIDNSFVMLYAIARYNSKITSQQFVKFCHHVGSPLRRAPLEIKKMFNEELIEQVFVVEETAYNASQVRKILKAKLRKEKVPVQLGSEVLRVGKVPDGVEIVLNNKRHYVSTHVFNCTYAGINSILKRSNLPLLSLKYEYTEMPLLRMPEHLKNYGVTIMDGPFFSIMPFPDKKLHSLHHVRYTPHYSWTDKEIAPAQQKSTKPSTKFLYMFKDASRYIPSLRQIKYIDSLYETKTVLFENELNDRRPIVFRKNHGIKNFHVVMGGKIDNIYDVFDKIRKEILTFSAG